MSMKSVGRASIASNMIRGSILKRGSTANASNNGSVPSTPDRSLAGNNEYRKTSVASTSATKESNSTSGPIPPMQPQPSKSGRPVRSPKKDSIVSIISTSSEENKDGILISDEGVSTLNRLQAPVEESKIEIPLLPNAEATDAAVRSLQDRINKKIEFAKQALEDAQMLSSKKPATNNAEASSPDRTNRPFTYKFETIAKSEQFFCSPIKAVNV